MSSYTIEHKYVWRELTPDGLLIKPEDCGPYYDSENVNGWSGGYDSEQQAYNAFLEFKEKYPFGTPSHLVLIKETLMKLTGTLLNRRA